MSKWRLPTQEVSNREELEFYSSEKCEICGRNVFVAVHEGDEDCHTITERLKEQGLTIRNCEQKDGKTIIYFDKCIFHVEKINEIWMENHREYRQWIEKRRKGEETEKDFTVNWNREFVREFWRLIRKYKDEKYDESTDRGRWGILGGEKILHYYFALFVFPMFEQLELNEYRYDINNETFVAPHSFSFWNGGDGIKFRYQVYFTKARFLGYADFRKSQFHEYVDFANAKFFNHAIFSEVQFLNNANFREARFLDGVNFRFAQFLKDAHFSNTQIFGKAYFDGTQFLEKAHFTEAIFFKEVSLNGAEFIGDVSFEGAQFKDKVDCISISISTKIGVSNKFPIFNGHTYFRKTQFEGEVNFRHVEFKYVDFWKARFLREVGFYGVLFSDNAVFSEAEFYDNVHFVEIRMSGRYMIFKQAVFTGNIVNFISLQISQIDDETEISFKDVISKSLRILIREIKKIEKSGKNNDESKESKEKNKKVERLKIVFPLSIETFVIADSDLSEFKSVCFEGYIENVKFINVSWGEINSDRFCPDLFKNTPQTARDIYRQLKLALDKQENYIYAREFYALEMEARGEEIKPTFNLKNKILTIIGIFFIIGIYSYLTRSFIPEWKYLLIILDVVFLSSAFYVFTVLTYRDLHSWQAFSDYVVYEFYKITSVFGLSWVRPLMFLFGFLLIKVLLDIFNFDGNFSRFTAVLDQLAYELLLLIPGAKNLVKDKPIDWAFLKLIYYSFVAYLIYQFVMALRRKVRR